MELVHAQETERILDRLVGYTVSPLLWKRWRGGSPPGGFNPVAVRLLVQRERARRAFAAAATGISRPSSKHEPAAVRPSSPM